MSDNSKKNNLISRRTFLLTCGKFIFFSVLASRFFYLQVFSGSRYKSLADSNRMREEIVPQARGLIIDRHNVVLARNIKQYSLVLNAAFFDQAKEIIMYIENLLKKNLQNILKDFHKSKKYAIKYRIPFMIIPVLTQSEVVLLECDLYLANKIDIVSSFRRYYPKPMAFSHILGYIAKPSLEEIKAQGSQYGLGSIEVGKNGVEKIFDDTLQGKPALRRIEVDAQGRYVRQLEYIAGKPGQNLQLSIDSKKQEITVAAMGQRVGSVILLDLLTGEVLAQYSAPGYDINEFITGINSREWKNLLGNRDLPLINKAVSASYPPGSTFKPVTALAMLNGGISAEERVFCNGQYQVNGRVFHCWKSDGHGYVDLNHAMAQSCNVYFYTQGRKVGITRIGEACELLGLGKRTGIQLPAESTGLVPSPLWKLQRLKQRWLLGDTINASIGQGYLLTTPIQLAVMIARIASGKLIIPSLVKQKSSPEFAPLYSSSSFESGNIQRLRQALYAVFNAEYGLNYKHRWLGGNWYMVGKTGSAQVISQRKVTAQGGGRRNKEHALFVGYFPHDKPRYAISVVVEHGEWGALSAMPVALEIARKIYIMQENN